ncbi:MAG: hypothetical protein ACJ78X_03905 [Myxococcales bacterium]
MLPLAAARAAQPASDGPVRLSDQELEQVSAGDGSLLDLNVFLNVMLKNIAVTVNVSNVPINAGLAVQANALGSAEQLASVTALQSVTQLQTFPGFPQ